MNRANVDGGRGGVNLPALRGHNEALLLDLLRAAGPPGLGRAELAARTGLTPQAVSKITARLTAEGLVAEAGRDASTGGKPRTRLRLVPGARCAVGVHLDRDELRAVRVDLAGGVVEQWSGLLDFGVGPEAVAEAAVRAVGRVSGGLEAPLLLGVGVAAPGPLDWRTGVLGRVTGFPEWEGYPLKEVLAGRLGVAVVVDKDTNAGVAAAGWGALDGAGASGPGSGGPASGGPASGGLWSGGAASGGLWSGGAASGGLGLAGAGSGGLASGGLGLGGPGSGGLGLAGLASGGSASDGLGSGWPRAGGARSDGLASEGSASGELGSGGPWSDGRGSGSAVYLHFGTGLGAGLRLGGAVYRGARSGAGEFGHQVLRPDGPPCRCGGRGCLEVLCLEAVARGDLAGAARVLGEGAANLVALLDVDRVLLGGRVVAGAPEVFVRGVREVLAARALTAEPPVVGLAPAGVAEGAAELVLAPLFGRG
ncbi:MarR family protein [Streptomyces sp. 3211.6]|uniref:ROK family transcriptional regulator n=1 Tax=Streptomyces sp. 3211.6 TaxID=1938845 RepID=UPI000F12D334|nr:ROK family transcriptional regulator [Streptomyces sp. 3211.6]RKT04875.1 MarR family protein [Streptomyces sp. 3211.6]